MTKPISKGRFAEFVEGMKARGIADVEKVSEVFCQVFDFDPSASTYDPVRGLQFIAWRRNKLEKLKQGVKESS